MRECDFSAAILLLLLKFSCMQTRTAARNSVPVISLGSVEWE